MYPVQELLEPDCIIADPTGKDPASVPAILHKGVVRAHELPQVVLIQQRLAVQEASKNKRCADKNNRSM